MYYLRIATLIATYIVIYGSVSYQLTGQKSNLIFRTLKYLIERTACSIQQVDYIE